VFDWFSNPNGEQVNPTYYGAERKRQPSNLLGRVFSSDPLPPFLG
jgi:hypothetical protein